MTGLVEAWLTEELPEFLTFISPRNSIEEVQLNVSSPDAVRRILKKILKAALLNLSLVKAVDSDTLRLVSRFSSLRQLSLSVYGWGGFAEVFELILKGKFPQLKSLRIYVFGSDTDIPTNVNEICGKAAPQLAKIDFVLSALNSSVFIHDIWNLCRGNETTSFSAESACQQLYNLPRRSIEIDSVELASFAMNQFSQNQREDPLLLLDFLFGLFYPGFPQSRSAAPSFLRSLASFMVQCDPLYPPWATLLSRLHLWIFDRLGEIPSQSPPSRSVFETWLYLYDAHCRFHGFIDFGASVVDQSLIFLRNALASSPKSVWVSVVPMLDSATPYFLIQLLKDRTTALELLPKDGMLGEYPPYPLWYLLSAMRSDEAVLRATIRSGIVDPTIRLADSLDDLLGYVIRWRNARHLRDGFEFPIIVARYVNSWVKKYGSLDQAKDLRQRLWAYVSTERFVRHATTSELPMSLSGKIARNSEVAKLMARIFNGHYSEMAESDLGRTALLQSILRYFFGDVYDSEVSDVKNAETLWECAVLMESILHCQAFALLPVDAQEAAKYVSDLRYKKRAISIIQLAAERLGTVDPLDPAPPGKPDVANRCSLS